MCPVVTVIVPTHDHGPTLRFSVQSALEQTVSDLEVVIVGDGMPAYAREVALELADRDARVRLEEHPKGPRHGEVYRRAVIEGSEAQFIFYLSDDDIWLPDHVERLLALLEDADFAHSLPVLWRGDGSLWPILVDLQWPYFRRLQVEHPELNRLPLATVAHTRALYERLPHGWRTTPAGIYTDGYMWQQILGVEDCRAVSGTVPTVLNLPSSLRAGAPLDARVAELERCWRVVQDPEARIAYLSDVVAAVSHHAAWAYSHREETAEWLANREGALEWHQRRLEELRPHPGPWRRFAERLAYLRTRMTWS